MKHYFITLPDVVFPENRFCAKCGEYLTHSNHLHARECPCLKCQQERRPTQRAADGGYCTCPQSVPRYDAGDGWKCHWCHRPRR